MSPAYDINPNEFGTGLSVNIYENDNALDIDLALEVAPYFRLNNSTTQQIIKKIHACEDMEKAIIEIRNYTYRTRKNGECV